MTFILAFGILDQGQAARPLIGRYAIDAAAFHAERTMVQEIERRHPAGGAVMQLPEMFFTADADRARMFPYDHARPYLASTKLSWSWPSYSARREAWYTALGSPTSGEFPDRLAPWKFIGIWIDRFGYPPSELAPLEAALSARFGPPLVGGMDDRYAYFDFLSQRPASDTGAPTKQ